MDDKERPPPDVDSEPLVARATLTKPFKRRLMAVMFTDIKGFSAMMGEDELRTIRAVERHRRTVRACVARHDGKEQDTIGDAFLVLFDSAVNAVDCAVAIQRGLAADNEQTPKEEQVLIRIGIHLGDVLVADDGDIAGDNVNIAARVEPLAQPGGICITDGVHAQCAGRTSVRFRHIGRKPMKNIKEPPDLYWAILDREDAADSRTPARAGRGRAAAIAAALAAVAVGAFLVLRGGGGSGDPSPPPPGTTPTLGGAPGTPAPPGGLAGPAAPPPDGADGATDAAGEGGPPAPDETKTEPAFSGDPTAQKRFRMAYDAFLAGHLDTAEKEFEAALAIDSDSPLGHLLVGNIYQNTGREMQASREMGAVFAGYERIVAQVAGGDATGLQAEQRLLYYLVPGYIGSRPVEEMDRLFSELARAYPNLMIVYLLWGDVLASRDRCDLADRPYDRCIEKDPSVVMAYIYKALCRIVTGDYQEALGILEGALKWHPDSPYVLDLTGETMFVLGRHEDSFERLKRAALLDPGMWQAKMALATQYLLVDREDEAKQTFAGLSGENVPAWVGRTATLQHATALRCKGRFAEALAIAESGMRRATDERDLLKAWSFATSAMSSAVGLHRWEDAERLVAELRNMVADLDFPAFAKNYRLLEIVVYEGMVAAEKGDVAAARAALARLENVDDSLLELVPKDEKIVPLQWRVLAADGKVDDAVALLRFEPDSPAAALPYCSRRRDLARVLTDAGRTEEAAEALDALLRHSAFCSVFLDMGYAVAQALVWRAEISARTDPAEARRLLDRYDALWPNPDPTLDVVVRARRLAADLPR